MSRLQVSETHISFQYPTRDAEPKGWGGSVTGEAFHEDEKKRKDRKKSVMKSSQLVWQNNIGIRQLIKWDKLGFCFSGQPSSYLSGCVIKDSNQEQDVLLHFQWEKLKPTTICRQTLRSAWGVTTQNRCKARRLSWHWCVSGTETLPVARTLSSSGADRSMLSAFFRSQTVIFCHISWGGKHFGSFLVWHLFRADIQI